MDERESKEIQKLISQYIMIRLGPVFQGDYNETFCKPFCWTFL